MYSLRPGPRHRQRRRRRLSRAAHRRRARRHRTQPAVPPRACDVVARRAGRRRAGSLLGGSPSWRRPCPRRAEAPSPRKEPAPCSDPSVDPAYLTGFEIVAPRAKADGARSGNESPPTHGGGLPRGHSRLERIQGRGFCRRPKGRLEVSWEARKLENQLLRVLCFRPREARGCRRERLGAGGKRAGLRLSEHARSWLCARQETRAYRGLSTKPPPDPKP